MVFVIDTNKQPLSPCHPAKARRLLRDGVAAIWCKFPFTIILQKAVEPDNLPTQETRLKIDFGSRHTGLAILQRYIVVWLAQLNHRINIAMLLEKRSNYRRRRRSKNLRYRKCRSKRKTYGEGWVPPSLQSRVDNIETWVRRLRRVCPITHISYENCKFDTQLMRDAEINGVEYQQGTLLGYTVREYLLEKYDHACCYCGGTGMPLEIEHIIPRCRAGSSDRVDNLCLACHSCNQAKGDKTAAEYGYPNIQAQAKEPLADCAIINATRWKAYNVLKATDLDVECGSGALTKMQRIRMGIGKSHCNDACCIGVSTPAKLIFKEKQTLSITAMGRGQHRRTNVDEYGFPTGYLPRQKRFFGFQTGDMVKAEVPKGKKQGIWYGRVACRNNGYFNIKTKTGMIQGISHRYCMIQQRGDGYEYALTNC